MRTPHIYNRGNFYKQTFQSGGLPIFQGHMRKRGGGKISDFMKKVGKIVSPLGKQILHKVKRPVIRAALESGKHLIQGHNPTQVLKHMTKKHAPRILKNAAEAVMEPDQPQRRRRKIAPGRRRRRRGGGIRTKIVQKGKTVKKNIFNE